MQKATNNKYIPGIYCNKDIYNIIKTKVGNDLINNFELWIAGSKYYYRDDINKELSISDIKYQDNTLFDTKYGINQISNIIAGNGFPVNDNNHMDVNYCYVDYVNFNRKENNHAKLNLKNVINIGLLSIISLSFTTLISSTLVGRIYNKKKVQMLKKRTK